MFVTGSRPNCSKASCFSIGDTPDKAASIIWSPLRCWTNSAVASVKADASGRREGAVTVLDVRPPDEFALGHVPGAVNIPVRALKERLAEINPDHEIVAYCRGAYCVFSFEAVAFLRARGLKVRRLEEGLPEWRAAGLPIKIGRAGDH